MHGHNGHISDSRQVHAIGCVHVSVVVLHRIEFQDVLRRQLRAHVQIIKFESNRLEMVSLFVEL